MGKEIIRPPDNKPETLIRLFAKSIVDIGIEQGISYSFTNSRRLARKFLYDESYIDFLVPSGNGKSFRFPTVRLELWLLERQYEKGDSNSS